MHPKMRYTYVGIDSHKDTHTAVFIDCFFEKQGELEFKNLSASFEKFLKKSEKFKIAGTELMFGLEDASYYGRTLAEFLLSKGFQVKHVNSVLVARERKNQNITQKTDSIDAECAARILISKFGSLPDVELDDKYWILRMLVVRRDLVMINNKRLKTYLHSLLTQHFPKYQSYFEHIDGKTALAFFMKYPSPSALKSTTVEELTDFLYEQSGGFFGLKKAKEILENTQKYNGFHNNQHIDEASIQDIQNSEHQQESSFQKIKDSIIQSTIRQFLFNQQELERLENELAIFLKKFDCPLLSMNGLEVVSASQLLSCIGDIKRFSTPAKLARFAGIAPVTYASGRKETQYSNQRGNRELNSIFYGLAVRVSSTFGSKNKALNPFFYEYYNRKLSEGKTKRQALKCVQRRLVNIIWTMLTNNEEYVNPPMFDMPKKEIETKK
jgi:transposase